ncbi:MAG: hypothetical protein EHJ95_01325, partial [Methanobacteriota archaeon]
LLLEPYLSSIINPTPPQRTPRELDGHVVIAGYGELTREIVEDLAITDVPIVIVEENMDIAREIDRLHRQKVFVVWGDYGETATWEHAHVGRASAVIVSEDERAAANVILGIRTLTKGTIVAVVDDLAFDRYLYFAGADRVVSPKNSTGQILGKHAVIRRSGETIADGLTREDEESPEGGGTRHGLRLVMIPVMPGSRAIGKTCRELRIADQYGIHVIAYWRSGTFVAEPPAGDCVDATTMLYVLGRGDAIEALISEEFSTGDNGTATAIVAGFGDVGKAAFRELAHAGIDCVVVDRKEQMESGIVGNAEDDAVLLGARIDEAKICVVAINDDNVNIFTTLMARNMNPAIRILARANEPASVDRLYRAGADYVALLPAIGGQVVAGIVLSGTVTVMLDLPDRRKVIARRLARNAPASVEEIEQVTGVQVLGIERSEGQLVMPPRSERIGKGDTVIVIGENRRIRRFIERY